MGGHQKICRLFAELVRYPVSGVGKTARECRQLLARKNPEAVAGLQRFLDFIGENRSERLEEVYTATFDLQPSCHPYVGYQLCGEGHQRGRFMVKLQEIYQGNGFACGRELPDHLGEMLSFLSALEDGPMRDEIIGEALLPALAKMLEGFENETNPYSGVLVALRSFLGGASCSGSKSGPPTEVAS